MKPLPPLELEYPPSAEGTIRCTCGQYPHAHGCGSAIGQQGWETGYQRCIDDHGWTRGEDGLASKPALVQPAPALTKEQIASFQHHIYTISNGDFEATWQEAAGLLHIARGLDTPAQAAPVPTVGASGAPKGRV